MTGVMKVTGRSGHTEVEWNTEKPETVRDVEAEFWKLIERNYKAFRVERKGGRREAEQVDKFDPEAEEYIMAVPMAGGC